MKTFAILSQLFLAILIAFPAMTWAGGILISDLRMVDAYASGTFIDGPRTDHHTFQATFGQNPFSATATAGVSGFVPGFGGGGASANASLTTQFTPGPDGFSEFMGTASISTRSRPDYFGGTLAESLVDVTFHASSLDLLQITGTAGSQLTLSRSGGPLIFAAPAGRAFTFTTLLSTGDYRFVSDVKLDNPFGGGNTGFQFDMKFGVPEPSTLILAAIGGLALLARRRGRP